MAQRLQTTSTKHGYAGQELPKSLRTDPMQHPRKSTESARVAMCLEPHKLKNSTTDELVIRVMTMALTLTS